MRIAYLTTSGQMGGAETSVLEMMASVGRARSSWTLHLITPATGPLAARATALGAHVSVLPFGRTLARLGEAGAGGVAGRQISRVGLVGRLARAGVASRGHVRQLRQLLESQQIDVVHTHGLKMHVLAARALPSHAALVWHMHEYLDARPLTRRLLKFYSRRAAAIVANSRSVAASVRGVANGGLPVAHIYNAVDLDRFTPTGLAADLDAFTGVTVPRGAIRVGIVATMARWKGHEVFLRALATLPRDLNVYGYIVGDAVYETVGSQHSVAELRERAVALGVSDRVAFTGYVEDVAPIMRALDVIVHASTAPEPFGMVIAEAMACGRAVIASRAGGAAELFESNVDALDHTPGDADDLARCIAQLAADEKFRRQLGARARERAERAFASERLGRDCIALYEQISPVPASGKVATR